MPHAGSNGPASAPACTSVCLHGAQDGSESGNVIEGNLGLMIRESYALTHSDTAPAAFLLSNPNNTVRNNRAAGSAGVGFWLRFYDTVSGE